MLRHFRTGARGPPLTAGTLPPGPPSAPTRPRGPGRLSRGGRTGLLAGLCAAVALGILAVGPIAQDPAYHAFADRRTLLGVPNALDVLSNAALLFAGVAGLALGARRPAADAAGFTVFFAGLALTGVGSAWYHLAPDDARLVWDRVPMTIAFAGVTAAVVADRVGRRPAAWALPLLLLAGAGSVWLWRATGDLRGYAVVQYVQVLAVPLLVLLFPSRWTRGRDLGAAALLYGLAKAFEALDAEVLAAGGLVSGHTLKHLAAAGAGVVLLLHVRRRRPRDESGGPAADR